MKKITMAAALFALALASGCGNGGKTTETATPAPTAEITVQTGFNIAYVNMDSLLMNFDMYKELQSEFEAKAKKVGDNLNARGSKLQRDIADFQEKVEKVLVTRAQATEMEADLNKRQQELVQYSNKVQGELAEEETVMLNRIHHSISEYLREYNSGYRYTMILSSSPSTGPVLDAAPSLNITDEIVAGLNKRYAESKK